MADGQPWDKLSENMRKAILYHHILESVSTNLGNTLSDTTAMRMSVFTASLQDLKLALGTAFLPIVNTVLPYLNTFIRWIESALKYVYSFTYALFGYTGAKGGKAQKQTEAQTQAVSDLGDATEKAGKKAKKAGADAKRGVMGFDEVNILDDVAKATEGASGGGGGAKAPGGPAQPDFTPMTPQRSEWMQDLNKQAAKLGKAFRNFFANSKGWQTLKDAVKRFKDAIEDLWKSKEMKGFVKWLGGGWAEGFDGVMMQAAGVIDIFAGSIDILNFLLTGDTTKAWTGIGKIIRGVSEFLEGTFGPLFPDLGRKWQKFNKDFFDGWEAMGNIDYMDLLVDSFKVFTNLKEWGIQKLGELTKETPKQVGLFNAAVHLGMGGLSAWFKENVTDKWIGHLEGTKKPAGEKSSGIWKAIQLAFGDPHAWFIKYVAHPLAQSFEEQRNSISYWAGRAWADIKEEFAPVRRWFKDNITDPITDAFNNIKKGFSISYKEGFKAMYNEGAKYINSMIDGTNRMVDKLNSMPMISGIPHIKTRLPYLAEGGITTRPTLAVVGDNPGGREVISPLDDLKSMIATSVMTAMGMSGGGGGGGDIVLNLDGRQFARIVKPHLDRESRRLGINVKMNPI